MRRWFAAMLVWSVASAVPARADDPDARAVIDKAVKALGGEKVLEKARAFDVVGRLQRLDRTGKPFEVSLRYTSHEPSGYRVYLYAEGREDLHAAPDMVWTGGPTEEKLWYFRPDAAPLLRRDLDHLNDLHNTRWQQAASFHFAPLLDGNTRTERVDDQTVEGRPAVGLKVTPPDRPPLTIHFDRESGLPVTVSFTGRSLARLARQTIHLRDYKTFGGLKVATHRVTDFEVGPKRSSEVFQVLEFTPLGKVDPAVFTEPPSVDAWLKDFDREATRDVPAG